MPELAGAKLFSPVLTKWYHGATVAALSRTKGWWRRRVDEWDIFEV
jgi:hypothetical protein